MLAGMQGDEYGAEPMGAGHLNMDIGESMFETLGGGPKTDFKPDADEMAARMARLQVNRKVNVKGVRARTYDLSIDDQRTAYEEILETLITGMTVRTHMILHRPPPQFVANGPTGPCYIAHLEWMEFELDEEPAPVVGASPSVEGAEHYDKPKPQGRRISTAAIVPSR